MIDLENKAILLLQESSFPFYYPVDWTDINTVALNKFQETGKWSLDLSFDPPKITP
jgi:hypothetical protein